MRDPDGFPMRIDGLQKLYNEIDLMRHLFHRNVSILFEVIDDPEEDTVVLVTEYMSGGAVMNYNLTSQLYEYSTSAANILQGFGKPVGSIEVPSGGEQSVSRRMTDLEAVSIFCDLLKV